MQDFFDEIPRDEADNDSADKGSDSEIEPSKSLQTLVFGWEILKVIIISIAIIIPVRYFLVQPFFVNGASMEETFNDADYILIDEISYRFKDPVRGDIVVFKFPGDEKQFFIKRVIGMPNETVKIGGNKVTIFSENDKDGTVLNEESYLTSEIRTDGNVTVRLGGDEYFVLGDNREHSSDSRFWGVVKRSQIVGRVFARAWPFSDAEFFDDPKYSE